jgi:hypothetical protein
MWKKEKSLALAWELNPDLPALCPSLHRLSYPNLAYTYEHASVLHVVRYTHFVGVRDGLAVLSLKQVPASLYGSDNERFYRRFKKSIV